MAEEQTSSKHINAHLLKVSGRIDTLFGSIDDFDIQPEESFNDFEIRFEDIEDKGDAAALWRIIQKHIRKKLIQNV